MDRQLRMTHQREIILQELRKSKTHPTADELYERIKKKIPRISLATVYRNLEILSKAGVISKLEISGRQKRFDWELAQHNHVYCNRCQRIENISSPILPLTHIESAQGRGYQITGCRIEFSGLCPLCQHQPNQATNNGEQTMPCETCEKSLLNDSQKSVLSALAQSAEPCGSKEISAATGLESKQISCQMTALKKKGYVESPVRCKYTITPQGKEVLSLG